MPNNEVAVPMDVKGYGLYGSGVRFKGDKDNFLIFSERFKCVLGVYNLDNVLVEGHTDAADADKKKKVYQLLVNSIDDESFKLIFSEAKNDGAKAFNILSDRYLGKKGDLEVEYLTNLFDVKLQANEDHLKFINRIDLIKSQLDSNKVELPDKAYTVLALKGLSGSKYEQFRSSVKVRKEWPLWSEFKSLIKVHESSMFSADNTTPQSEIVLSTNTNKHSASGYQYKAKLDVVCNYCRKSGHLYKNCYKRKAKLKQSKDSAKAVVDSSNSDEPDRSYFFKCGIFCGSLRSNEDSESLLIDSGATSHIMSDRKAFISFDSDYDPTDHYVELADGTRTNGLIKGKGKASFDVQDSNGNVRNITLTDALYIPTYNLNIFSVKKAADHGATFSISEKGCSMIASNGVDFPISCVNNLYYMNIVKPDSVSSHIEENESTTPVCKIQENASDTPVCKIRENASDTPGCKIQKNASDTPGCKILFEDQASEFCYIEDTSTDCCNTVNSARCKNHTATTWHCIFGHCNFKHIFELQKVVDGMQFTNKNISDCGTCTKGKMFETFSRTPDKRATAPFEFVHTDLNGPISPVSKEGFKYLINFTDDYSGNIAVYFLKKKSDTVAATKRFLADIAPFGKIKRLCCDNGTEYTSEEFMYLMIDNRIRQEFSSPYSPFQNGTAERSWRTLMDMARCFLIEAKVPKTWWPHALQAAAYIRNRCFNQRIGITPYEAITGKKPDVSSMHIWGTVCYAYIQNKGKLDPRSEEGIFLGYDRYSPAYIVYLPSSKTFRKVRNVKFTEKFPQKLPIPQPESPQVPDTTIPLPLMPPEFCQSDPPNSDDEAIEVRRNPPRDKRKPRRYDDSANITIDYCYRVSNVPRTYREAISAPDACKWEKAMHKELLSLEDTNSYDLVPRPKDYKVIGGRWVYTVKLAPNDQEEYKARYVCKGYSQIEEVDYLETFSPTPRPTTMRIVLQKALQGNMIINQMDFSTAYLNADIDTIVYIEPPDGFISDPNYCWRLNKALYGLKQSGRCWNNLLNNFLTSHGFNRSMSDPCLYTFFDGNNTVNLIVWVDDLLITASNQNLMDKIKDLLSRNFKMKDLGIPSYFLGIQFTFNKDSIVLEQSMYVDKLLKRFNMTDAKTKPTPCPLGINKELGNASPLLEDNTLYREIVGSLIYLMVNTRPDISYVVTLLGQYMSKPTVAHLNLAKHVLRYLKGTKSLGLNFVKSNCELNIYGYCDSDWGGSLDRKSISGYCFMLNKDGPLISWKSCKQNIIALSSCEAEYVSLTSAFKEAKFLRQLFADINGCKTQPVNLFGDKLADIKECEPQPVHLLADNQGAIALAKNPVHHQKSKHIDIRFHFICFDIDNGTVILEYIPTDKNIADLFTKPLSGFKFKDFSSIRGPMV